jgi:pilus assembly protein CpaC
MHPKLSRRTLAWGLALAAGVFGTLAVAQPPMQPGVQPSDVKVDKTGALIVPVGGLVRFDPKLKDPVTDVLVSREDILQVRPDPMNPGVLLLTGRNPGLAQMTLVVKDQPPRRFDVVVQPDLELLRNIIRRTVPTANVTVEPGIGNVIILGGYVTSPQDADTILRLANSAVGGSPQNVINAIQVGGVQQVQIDVVVASVDRNEIRSRGFDFLVSGSTVQISSLVSGLIGAPPLGGAGAVAGTVSPSANIQVGIVPAQFFGALQALRTEGLAKFLAEPRVVTQTGRPAFFLAGGRQAVLGPAAGINGPGVVFEQVGTQLSVLPIVYGNGMIWLDINPQVRSVNQGLGITTVFGTTPGFTEQQAQCSVMLESGQTFAIGGLIQNSVQVATAKVPFLGDLPFVGTAFSSIRHEERESELVILVTPRLVHPLDCNQVPRRLPGRETRSPDDYELFLENILEAPRGQRKVFNGHCYNAAYKCDPTAATFPCVGNVCTGPAGAAGACGTTGAACPAPVTGGPAVRVGPPAPHHGVPPAGAEPGSLPAVPPAGGEGPRN